MLLVQINIDNVQMRKRNNNDDDCKKDAIIIKMNMIK